MLNSYTLKGGTWFTTLNGHFGFLNTRGRHSLSFENQLSKQVKSRIIFNSNTSYEQLLKDFTHVVLATGDAAYASKIQETTLRLPGTSSGNADILV